MKLRSGRRLFGRMELGKKMRRIVGKGKKFFKKHKKVFRAIGSAAIGAAVVGIGARAALGGGMDLKSAAALSAVGMADQAHKQTPAQDPGRDYTSDPGRNVTVDNSGYPGLHKDPPPHGDFSGRGMGSEYAGQGMNRQITQKDREQKHVPQHNAGIPLPRSNAPGQLKKPVHPVHPSRSGKLGYENLKQPFSIKQQVNLKKNERIYQLELKKYNKDLAEYHKHTPQGAAKRDARRREKKWKSESNANLDNLLKS